MGYDEEEKRGGSRRGEWVSLKVGIRFTSHAVYYCIYACIHFIFYIILMYLYSFVYRVRGKSTAGYARTPMDTYTADHSLAIRQLLEIDVIISVPVS